MTGDFGCLPALRSITTLKARSTAFYPHFLHDIMILHLRVLSLHEQPYGRDLSTRFEHTGGTIGRADHNQLVLPDPERLISRVQAEISRPSPGQGFVITNVSHANAITVSGRSVAQGETIALKDRDAIRIGGYLIEARVETPVEDTQHTIVKPASHRLDPFIDLAPVPPVQPAPPLAFDPFTTPSRVSASTQSPPARSTNSAPARSRSPVPSATSSLDDLFGLGTPSSGDPLAGFLAQTPPPPSLPTRSSPPPQVEPALLRPSATSPATSPTAPPTVPPRVTAPAAAVPSTGSATSTSDDPLWQAFCQGAGVALPMTRQLTPELMQMLGQILRSAVNGTQQLVAIRAASRAELHAQVTMIKARDNNPLKFAPDGTAALEQLLQPPVRGFLAGPDAMTDVMNDLVGHSIGTMAGTRSALDGVLDRFEPSALESQLGTGSVLDQLVPMSRKARLWELYLQHYQRIRNEAQEDFHTLFGKAFLSAYEEQIQRLRAQQQAEAQPGR